MKKLPYFLIPLLCALYSLGSKSLWLDEAWALNFSQFTLLELWQASWERNAPLYYLILGAWANFFGTTEFALRLPSAIAFALAVYLWIEILSLSRTNPRGQIFFLLLISTSPFFLDFAQMARVYAFFLLAAGINNYFFLKFLNERARSSLIYYSLSATLLLYTHYFAFFCIASQLLYLLINSLTANSTINIRALKYYFLALIIAGLLYLPWGINIIRQVQRLDQTGFWIEKLSIQNLIGIFSEVSSSPSLYLTIFIVIFFLICMAFAWRDNKAARLWAINFLLPIFISYLYGYFSTSILHERYLIVSIASLYVLLVSLLDTRYRLPIQGILIILILLNIARLNSFYQQPKEDWRAISKELSQCQQTLVIPTPYRYPLKYYYQGEILSQATDLNKDFVCVVYKKGFVKESNIILSNYKLIRQKDFIGDLQALFYSR